MFSIDAYKFDFVVSIIARMVTKVLFSTPGEILYLKNAIIKNL